MLDLYASIISSAHHAGWLVAALISYGLAGLLVVDFARRYRYSLKAKGRIIDVTENTDHGVKVYIPIIQFIDHQGKTHIVESDMGSSRLSDKAPGKEVELYYRIDNPAEIAQKSYLQLYIAAVIGVIGAVAAHFFLATYQLNILSYVFAGLLVLMIIFGYALRPNEDGQLTEGRPPSEKTEGMGSLAYHQQASLEKSRMKKAAPITLLMAALLIGGSGYVGYGEIIVKMTYTATKGIVSNHELKSILRDGKRVYTYYPLVTFATDNGKQITFQDSIGGPAPLYAQKQAVDVLYNPQNPDKARIGGTGLRWILAIGGILIGLGLLFSGLHTLTRKD